MMQTRCLLLCIAVLCITVSCTHTAAPHAPQSIVAPDRAIVGHWCDSQPRVVIAIDKDGRVEMDGHGHAQCALLPASNARKVRCTYKHLPDRVHVYDLKPGIDTEGNADPLQMQVELHWEHSHSYMSLRLCEDHTIHSARNRESTSDWVPEQGQLTWKLEGESNQASRFFSRRLHRADWLHSKTATTLLIGRGYRLRDRSASQIQHDLMLAGLTDESLLAVFTGAAELHGAKADEYLMRREHRDAVIPVEVERKLFDEQYKQAQRDVIRRVGRHYADLPPTVQELLVDLQFSNHLSDSVFARLNNLIGEQNWSGFIYLLSQQDYWLQDVGISRKRHAALELLISNVVTQAQSARQVINHAEL